MTDPTTRETADHAELARLAEAATAGPWETYPEAFSPRSFVIPTHHASDDPAVGSVLSRQDAAFIAAANPATVLALLSEIAALRGALAAAQNADAENDAHLRDRATQAERQRDELRKALERIAHTPDGEDGLSLTECVNIARQALASQGAD